MRDSEFLSGFTAALGRTAENSAHGDTEAAKGFEVRLADEPESDDGGLRFHRVR
jgi:hypothetical protein